MRPSLPLPRLTVTHIGGGRSRRLVADDALDLQELVERPLAVFAAVARLLVPLLSAVAMVASRNQRQVGIKVHANELKPGSIVRGPILPEAVEVLVVTPLGDVIKIV